MRFSNKLLCSLFLAAASLSIQAQPEKVIPKISTFIKPGAKQYKGMFNIYVQDDKYLVEVPDQLLERDILTNITIIQGSAQRKRNAEMRFGYAGDAVGDQVIRFRKGLNGKIELVMPAFVKASDSSNIYFNALKADLVPGLLALDVIATGNSSSLIDVTTLFAGDNDLFSLKIAKDELRLGSFEAEKSKILGVSCFENNIVFRSLKSYGPGVPPESDPEETGTKPKKLEANPTLWEVGSSWFLLPEIPMTPRYGDKRIGYFLTTLNNYDKNPQRVESVPMANRWRLVPKAGETEKYLKGELVEPQKPIVFYIDRNMPLYLVPFITKGVNAWQEAFEKIGFKNAIVAKLAPTVEEDPSFSMEDARYSYISYKPSAMANAYGPQVVDPRSGEILSSHVALFHGILDLLQSWYFSMCAATNPQARKFPFDQDLMGSLITNVITHEVGHTLGLRHNFAGSSSYSTDSIRNKAYVQKNSFGPSIMDYMRFNYAAQPQDEMAPADLLPKIGVYDEYAIDWGYRYYPEFKNSFAESKYLSSWVSMKRKDPKFFYLDEGNPLDPRIQAEDVGDNNMKANRLGVENLKLTMANLEKWTAGDDENYTVLRSMYRAIKARYYNYLIHVVKNVAGVNSDDALRTENKNNYSPVSLVQQKEAMAYLTDYLFNEPTWLYPENIKTKTGFNFTTDVEKSYGNLFGKLIAKYAQLSKNGSILGDSTYTVKGYLSDLQQAAFSKIKDGKPISEYDRFMQRTFVNKLLADADNRSNLANDVILEMKRILALTAQQALAAATINEDVISKSHLISIAHAIDVWRTGKKDSFLSK